MEPQIEQFFSDAHRRSYDLGKAKGEAEGEAKGEARGRLTEARAALRRVLVHRQLTPSNDEDARIEACTDLATLERWNDQAFTAVSVTDALK